MGRSIVIFGSILRSNYSHVFDVFLDLVNSFWCILWWSNHGPAHAFGLFIQIRPEVDPGRRKNRSMRGPFSKGLLLQIGMQQQQRECILVHVSWIERSRFFAVWIDFTNMAVMLSDLLRNLTLNRSAHCTQVSDQCPFELLFCLLSTLTFTTNFEL